MDLGWPSGLTLYRLLADWGSFIGGLLALAAGIIAFVGAICAARHQNAGTMAATDKQIREMRRTERLRARGIVVAVYPELVELEAAVDGRLKYVGMGFTPDRAEGREEFLNIMLLRLNPLMERNIDAFYLLRPGGASLLQIVSVLGQYNRMVERIDDSTWPLNGQLLALRQAITDAMNEIGRRHDEAVKNAPVD